MLSEVIVSNLGPIGRGDMVPSRGLTAITGETGAGKSMLLSAIGLISGGPVPRRAVPEDGETVVQGVFDLGGSPSVAALAAEQGFLPDDDVDDGAGDGSGAVTAPTGADGAADVDDGGAELIITRTVRPTGRGRIRVNGMAASRGVVHGLTSGMLTVHGQNEQSRLLDPSVQLTLLDEYAGDAVELAAYVEAHRARTGAEAEERRLASPEARRRARQLRGDIETIEAAGITPGEKERLTGMLDEVEALRSKAEAYREAAGILSVENGPLEYVADALGKVRDHLDEDDAARFEEALSTLEEMADMLASEDMDQPDFDVDAAEERLAAIDRVLRLYGDTEEDVIKYLRNARKELAGMNATPERMAELRDRLERARRDEDSAAAALTASRTRAAAELQHAVNGELGALAMGGSAITIEIDGTAPTATGRDEVRFMLQPHPSAKPLPLRDSASGGELSRISLVLELSLAARHPSAGMTFVFDEIDAGIGAATGFELGRRIAELARSSQVIIVTHLAQVASWADKQYEIRKTDGSTTIRELDHDARIEAISRMFDGDTSEIGREHAAELLRKSELG